MLYNYQPGLLFHIQLFSFYLILPLYLFFFFTLHSVCTKCAKALRNLISPVNYFTLPFNTTAISCAIALRWSAFHSLWCVWHKPPPVRQPSLLLMSSWYTSCSRAAFSLEIKNHWTHVCEWLGITKENDYLTQKWPLLLLQSKSFLWKLY